MNIKMEHISNIPKFCSKSWRLNTILKDRSGSVEGFGRMICGLLGFPAPRWTTIWYRIQNITLASLFEDKSLASKGEPFKRRSR